MENKINISELLKDCPKGMELYSPIFGKVYLNEIRPHLAIVVTTDKYKEEFLYDGRYGLNGECMLFPSKGKTTWEGIKAPFKDGDVVSTGDGIFTAIVRKVVECEIEDLHDHAESYETYCNIYYEGEDEQVYFNIGDTPLRFCRIANEEEKERLFQAIKKNGYKWNAGKKILEKLSTSKFDITALKPFESTVLVRDKDTDEWRGHFFSHYDNKSDRPYICIGVEGINEYKQCIPYNGNEHLLSTTNDCDEYYKTWE